MRKGRARKGERKGKRGMAFKGVILFFFLLHLGHDGIGTHFLAGLEEQMMWMISMGFH